VTEIKFSNQAIEKLAEVVRGHPNAMGLRLEITGRMGGEFEHRLTVVEKAEEVADAIKVTVLGLAVPVFVEGRSAAYLDGVKIHYEYRGPDRSGLEFSNPNPLWRGPIETMLQQIIDTELNPAIAAHGGYINLFAVEGDTAYIEMGGGCVGCGMVDVTLKQGIEASIIGVVPGIERVVDQTDHASGTNPYYAPEKK
jgi:Fe-S cluster biogenesis protein NfuA/Fe-S cluster assembly iron-binding protein IscA